jgi:site-specific DNA recombinase
LRGKTERSDRRQAEKERIKVAFEGKNGVVVIPATMDRDYLQTKKLRVGAYCRVSTLDDAQAGSFEIQCQHFRELISQKPNWELVDIYADEGISGTSIHNRLGFQRMLEDAKAGKVDMILTKGISRFGRNLVDVTSTLRQLAALNPPVAVYFEEQGINTQDTQNDLLISIFAAIAQFESQMKSDAVRAGILWRMQQGIYRFPVNNLLGYGRDKYGKIYIQEDEAEIIRNIYGCYMDGRNAREIAEALTAERVPTIHGGSVWSSSVILSILRNEKYCGDVIFQKTFTKDYLTHKSVRNVGQRKRFRRENDHIAIIPRDDWNKVQAMLQMRHGSSHNQIKLLKQFYLTRIKSGILKGFVMFDPRWRKEELKKFFEKVDNEREW